MAVVNNLAFKSKPAQAGVSVSLGRLLRPLGMEPVAAAPVPSWPAMDQVLTAGQHGALHARVKYRLRLWRSWAHRHAFLEGLATLPVWHALFEHDAVRYQPLLTEFVDRRFSVGQRFEAMLADLRAAAHHFGMEGAQALVRGEAVTLCRQADFHVRLALNPVNCKEGHWALSLHDAQGRQRFNLSFAFTAPAAVLVASVQGVQDREAADDDMPAALQALTKAAHGLRPPHLLLAVFQMLCRHWGVATLHGIDPQHHVKGRWNHRRKRLKFDYRALWSEAGGQLDGTGHWTLPPQPLRRAEDDMPTRKRALYRKRYAMLDALGAQLPVALAQPRPEPR